MQKFIEIVDIIAKARAITDLDTEIRKVKDDVFIDDAVVPFLRLVTSGGTYRYRGLLSAGMMVGSSGTMGVGVKGNHILGMPHVFALASGYLLNPPAVIGLWRSCTSKWRRLTGLLIASRIWHLK